MRGFTTRAVHVGEEPSRSLYGDVVHPIHLSVTFRKKRVSEAEEGYVYSRTSNPTRDALEKKLAALEGAKYGLAFSSGLAAESTIILALLSKGDTIIAFDDLYGGTKRLFERVAARFGIRVVYVDARRPENVERELARSRSARMVWVETPTNPLLKLADLRAISEVSSSHGAILVVDNTFASPYFQNPLSLGADIVVHSATKYLSGHSDLVAGAVMVNDSELYERLRYHQNAIGAVLPPFDSWLLMRGLKTLALRMERHQYNAMRIAEHLEASSKVARVIYPGLESHPQHELARKQMRGYSGMLSFELEGGPARAVRFVENLKIIALAESLGGVESLIEIPALMTHASIPREERLRLGISDSLIRLSVGIEDLEDLIEDIDNALKTA
ncbi:MAG: PLP-dependent aspartate aminotransferase family protein [Desulfurococcales archaeon]|nr:PLP-dependent aspartate aminotransferase family protein [Desulfurococcales archaeon]